MIPLTITGEALCVNDDKHYLKFFDGIFYNHYATPVLEIGQACQMPVNTNKNWLIALQECKCVKVTTKDIGNNCSIMVSELVIPWNIDSMVNLLPVDEVVTDFPVITWNHNWIIMDKIPDVVSIFLGNTLFEPRECN